MTKVKTVVPFLQPTVVTLPKGATMDDMVVKCGHCSTTRVEIPELVSVRDGCYISVEFDCPYCGEQNLGTFENIPVHYQWDEIEMRYDYWFHQYSPQSTDKNDASYQLNNCLISKGMDILRHCDNRSVWSVVCILDDKDYYLVPGIVLGEVPIKGEIARGTGFMVTTRLWWPEYETVVKIPFTGSISRFLEDNPA